MPTLSQLSRRAQIAGVAGLIVSGAAVPAIASASPSHQQSPHTSSSSTVAKGKTKAKAKPKKKPKATTITSTGLKPGDIKHVWLIILENKSYDATFTGLNQNSYLWKTLPSQGVLLKNYYGTGHSSMDNYMSMVSGQAPEEDTQEDCSVEAYNFSSDSGIVTKGGSLKNDGNYGQTASAANSVQPSGANAPNGDNGCVYPTDVPTLFDQLNAAHKSWKGYARDLQGAETTEGSTTPTVVGRDDGPCGYPGSATNNPDTNPTYLSATADHPFPTTVTSYTGAQATDQYVAKHFPFAWFHSLIGSYNADGMIPGSALTEPATGTNCDASHIANLDSPTEGLYHDLKSASTTPAFSWITPDNCSDAHDAVCKGNNLSGSFTAAGAPTYQSPTPAPESTTPLNQTGGLYASDLFLKYYIPMIEASPAFKAGGLIDVTFDEGNPPFTYSNNSFNNANAYGPTDTDKPNATSGISADAAGETKYGKTVHSEPTGPNSTLKANSSGDQLYPGPGNNAFIDRPPVCTSTEPDVPTDCVPGIVRGGSGSSPSAATEAVAGNTSSTFIEDKSILADDTGREVVDTTDTTGTGGTSPIPANTFVGTVDNIGPEYPTVNTGTVTSGSFQLVDQSGNPVTPSGAVTSITLSAEGDPNDLSAGETADPLWDATDPTPGGGDTGSVLISSFIKPGSVSSVYYNHYSWLRTMEDLFQVDKGTDHKKLPAGTVSGGLDGHGHIGYAAQRGLDPFGKDVFTNPSGKVTTKRSTTVAAAPSSSGESWTRSNLPIETGIGFGLLAVAGLGLWRRRRPSDPSDAVVA